MNNGLLDPAIVSFVFTPLVGTVALLLFLWWKRIKNNRATLPTLDTPGLLLASAVRRMPAERSDWGAAMLAELAHLQHPSTRWQFALGGTRVALFPPRQGESVQTIMNNKTKSLITTFRSSALISFLIVLPFMLLAFMFDIVKRLNTFSLRNALDFIVVFGFLWLGLAAIILILMPIVRNIRAGGNVAANPVLTQGNAMKTILTNPTSAAIISFILALPFVTILSLLMLGIEPPLGPLEPLLKNPDPDQPEVLGSLIVLGAFLLAVLACIIVRAPIVRTMRAGGSLLSHPMNLMLAVVLLSFFTMLVVGLIVDQFPCWIGVPNCD